MKRSLKKPIEVVYEHGQLKPLERLPLKERQHVWVTILSDRSEEPTVQQLAQLATQSLSFHFLANRVENLYSLDDGTPI